MMRAAIDEVAQALRALRLPAEVVAELRAGWMHGFAAWLPDVAPEGSGTVARLPLWSVYEAWGALHALLVLEGEAGVMVAIEAAVARGRPRDVAEMDVVAGAYLALEAAAATARRSLG